MGWEGIQSINEQLVVGISEMGGGKDENKFKEFSVGVFRKLRGSVSAGP